MAEMPYRTREAGIQYAAAYPRHCERSEAIHSCLPSLPHDGLLRSALMHKRSAFVADNDG
jgi:hypothetical protein